MSITAQDVSCRIFASVFFVFRQGQNWEAMNVRAGTMSERRWVIIGTNRYSVRDAEALLNSACAPAFQINMATVFVGR